MAFLSWDFAWGSLTAIHREWLHEPGMASDIMSETCTLDRQSRIRFLVGRGIQRLFLSDAQLAAILLRGQRETAVQALAFQQRSLQRLTVNLDSCSLPTDYITSWALHVAFYTAGLRLYDSAAVPWYLVASAAGDLTFTATAPPVVLGTGTPTSLRLTDELATFHYIYPSLTGVVTTSTAAPAGTVLTSSVQLRDGYGSPWYLSISSVPVLTAIRAGTATLTADPIEPRALAYIDPKSFERLDPRATSTTPLYYTVLSSKQLRLSPVPTVNADLVHFYFGDGLTDCEVPKAFEQEAIWHAVKLALMQRGHLNGIAAAQRMEALGLQRLGPRYFPSHDTLDNYQMPSAPR